MTAESRPRNVAFYLPQFHPTAENDEWWGPGFSEWHTVAKARPLYRGHDQPRLAGALGFYDLRYSTTRQDQASLAQRFGIDGFCYWHYWFSGRRVLDRVAREVLESDAPDFGVCLGWANEPWTRVWSGQPRQQLMPMEYPGAEDEKAHFAYVEPFFHDSRYIRVDDRPMFVIYRPHLIPNLADYIAHWRTLAQGSGLTGIHFVGEVDSASADIDGLLAAGLDALVDVSWRRLLGRFALARKRLPPRPLRMSFDKAVARWDQNPELDRLYGSVLAGWDNTPRRGKTGWLLKDHHGPAFETHVRGVNQRAQRLRQPIVFVKSWNEWSEGNYLEPDHVHGTDLLESFARGSERCDDA
jgi:Glycosyltransferase WbsX